MCSTTGDVGEIIILSDDDDGEDVEPSVLIVEVEEVKGHGKFRTCCTWHVREYTLSAAAVAFQTSWFLWMKTWSSPSLVVVTCCLMLATTVPSTRSRECDWYTHTHTHTSWPS